MNNRFNEVDYYKLEGTDFLKNDKLLDSLLVQDIDLVFWKDHLAEFADTKKEVIIGEEDGHQIVKHVRVDGFIDQEGTPVSSENLGLMEWNILILAAQNKWLMENMRKLIVQMATMISQNSNNMPYNSFVASMKNINEDIVVLEGFYDEANSRGVV